MKKALGLILALGLVTSACGGSSTDPASANSCDELADAGIAVVQDALDSIAGMSMDELMVLTEQPEEFEKLETLDFDGRAEELGCDMEQLMCATLDRLTADGEAAGMFLKSIQEGC